MLPQIQVSKLATQRNYPKTPKGKSNNNRKAHLSALGTCKSWAADSVKGPAPTKHDPSKRSAATVAKAIVQVSAVSEPRTPVPPTSLTEASAVPLYAPAPPSPAVPSLAVDIITSA